MKWRRGAGKLCKWVCYFGIWVYFMVVASSVYALTKSGFLMGATIFLLNLLFWHSMSYIQNKTDALYKEIEKKETIQEIQDELSWNATSRMIRDCLAEEMYSKQVKTMAMLQFKTWYVNRMREIALGVRIWRT